MSYSLSEGSIMTIMNGGEIPNPIMQVLSLKKMNGSSGQNRYRVYLSDGKHTISFAMMTAPVFAKAGEKGVTKFSIIKVTRYITSVINNTAGKGDSRVLVLLDIELLEDGDKVGEIVGNPIAYSDTVAQDSNKLKDLEPPAPKVPKLSGPSNEPSVSGTRLNGSLMGQITHPISSLSPYQNKWIIKARVSNKTPIRTWSNSRGEGKLFSMDLVDESGEIRLTGFREHVDKFYDKIEIDKVYYISKCQLKPANKQYSSLKNDYEMTMVNETIIEECQDADLSNVPQTQYSFIPISKIAQLEANTMVDIIGIAKETSDLQTFQARTTGRELKKREVMLLDQSNNTITLTLWGAEAENFDGSNNPVIVLKGARISEFGGGKTLSTVSGTLFRINPELKEVYRLKGWYETEGNRVDPTNISAKTGAGASFSAPWMSFKQVVDQQLGSINATGDYYQVKATILMVKSENACYKACPTAECNKKVIDNSNGMFRCEKCNREYENFKWRLLCSMNVGDWSGNQWVSMFSSEAEKIIGKPAQEVGDLFENNTPQFTELMEKAHFKEFVLKCRAKSEVYNDEQRLKTVAVKVDSINYEDYNSHLINNINQLVASY